MSQYESQFEENLYQLRRDKLAQIAALVRFANPTLTDSEARYPNTFRFTHTLPELRAIGDPLSTEDLAGAHIEAAIAGRIVAIRVQGKAGFATLQQQGQRIQIYVRKDDVGDSPEQSEALFALYKLLDLGDHIGVRGYLMRTRTNELTLHASPIKLPGHEGQPAIAFLAKAMLALPDKFHGLEDIELRYRRRYLDLFTDTGETAEAAASAEQNPVILSEARSAQSKDPDAANPAIAAENLSTTERQLNRLPARDVFVKRAAILRSIRHFFDTRGYLEVETPMLHTIAGGAAARPFTTHHNALDIPLNLRIAPELYLKRLVVGGLDRVYEINRNFRNEGVSTQHNPEFTMLEFYQAYANYHDLMDLTQELITQVAQEVNGTTLTNFNRTEIDLSKWTKLSMRETYARFSPSGVIPPTVEELRTPLAFVPYAKRVMAYFEAEETVSDAAVEAVVKRVKIQENQPSLSRTMALLLATDAERSHCKTVSAHGIACWSKRHTIEDSVDAPSGKLYATVFEVLAEPHLIQPTIIYDFPLAVSPLSKIKPDEPDWVERFEFYIGGFEVGNAFSELNDPDDQRARFEAQLEDRKRGDDEAMAEVDEDYVRALGYGLPPTAGEGIGIDRLTMILTGSRSIRDVILFPLMRPHTQPAPEEPTE